MKKLLKATLLLLLTCVPVAEAHYAPGDCNDGYGYCFNVTTGKLEWFDARDNCKNKENGGCTGEPVDTFSGTFVHHNTDLVIPGRGLDVTIQRTYRNKGEVNGPFGYNWSFNYAVRAKKLSSGNYLIVGDEGHEFIYHADGANSLGEKVYRSELYSVLVEHADGTLTLLKKDGARFEFHPEGTLKTLSDRFGNTLSFAYYQEGGVDVKVPILGKTKYFLTLSSGIIARDYQLIRITDTYGRQIQLDYYQAADGLRQGRLKQITDYAGRTLTYNYNDNGDLISATSPATPEFPKGKTTSYTYSSGQSSEALNHNLLSITDPKQQTYLVNDYDTNDRVATQLFGSSTTTWVYDPANPKATVTDGNGNVTEFTFNDVGNPIKEKRFTRGVRAGDPAFYETTSEYNANSELTKRIFPKGNAITFTYSSDPFGDLLEERQKATATDPDGPSDLVMAYTYEPMFHQLRTVTDPRGFVATNIFDYQEGNNIAALATTLSLSEADVSARLAAAGIPMNLGDVNNDGRIDQTMGRLIKAQSPTATVEGSPQTSISLLSYNDAGQPLTYTDPEGHVTAFAYYPKNDPDGDGTPVPGQSQTTPIGYLKSVTLGVGALDETITTYSYDAVGNVATVKDGRGAITQFQHDALNQLVKIISAAPFLYEVRNTYDANGNLETVNVQNKNADNVEESGNPFFTVSQLYDDRDRLIEKTVEVDASKSITLRYAYDPNDNLVKLTQPAGNIMAFDYDERDLPYKLQQGVGTPDEAVTTINYDLNGNRREVIDPNGHAVTSTYDGFDRFMTATNALGHSSTVTYDKSDNPLSVTTRNNLGVKITDLLNTFDELGRLVQQDRYLLDASGAMTNTLTSSWVYDRNSQLKKLTDANTHHVLLDYDSLNRLIKTTDELGNILSQTFDKNSNVLTTTTTDLDDHTGTPDVITTSFAYDTLNRAIAVTDNTSHVASYSYDSRGNLLKLTDRQGNTVNRIYDGLSRVLSTIQDLRDAAGAITETITTTAAFDDNSRLTDLTDDNNHKTHYEYDALNRLRQKTLAFQSGKDAAERYTYDKAGNQLTRLDSNGVTTTYSYDELNRLTSKTDQAITESYHYDALNRLTQGIFQEGPTTTSTVDFAYDSLHRLLSETENALTVAQEYDDVGNRIRLTHPAASFFVTETPTALNQLDIIKDPLGTALADYDYLGPGRMRKRAYRNGTSVVRSYDALGRVVSHVHQKGATTLKGFQYGYDKVGNRLFEEQLHNAGVGDVYRYDSAYRLTKGWFNASSSDIQAIKTAIAGNQPIPAPANATSSTQYTLDGLGNRQTVDRNGTPEAYVSNALNEYDVVGGVPQLHDQNGNLTDDGTLLYAYDYEDRLTDVRKKSDNSLVVTYRYDALNRRIEKRFPDGTKVKYLYDGERIIEERDASDVLQARYVYGGGIDEILLMKRGGQDYFYHENSLGSIVAITNSAGDLVEQYTYDHYGVVTIRAPTGEVRTNSAIGNPWLFTGRQFDPETGLYYYRNRYYNPRTGRFLSRDPIGFFDGVNLYTYVNNNPINFIDPSGLEKRRQQSMRQQPINKGAVERRNRARPSGLWGFCLGLAEAAAEPVHLLQDIGYAATYRIYAGEGASPELMRMEARSMTAHSQASRMEQGVSATRVALTDAAVGVAVVVTAPVSVPAIGGYQIGTGIVEGDTRLIGQGTFTVASTIGLAKLAEVPSVLESPSAPPPAGVAAESVSTRCNVTAAESASVCEKATVKGGAAFGKATSTNYRAAFYAAHPELKGKVVVHHAIEQQALTRYPGVVSEAEIHSLENLRGIPNEINSDVHLSQIRREWNKFYRQNPASTKQQLLQQATEIDEKFGSQFRPSR